MSNPDDDDPDLPISMTADSEVLHEIANTTNHDLAADIVFVHGLGGASHATWRHGQEGENGHFFWPEELGKDLPHCGVWTVGYPAGFTALGKPGMIIEKRAGNLAQKLTNAGLGMRPLLFITHSIFRVVVRGIEPPDVPTFVESGYPQFKMSQWYGILAPAATPKPIIDKLNKAIVSTLTTPEVVKRYENQGMEAKPTTSANFLKLFKDETAKWAKVVREAKIPQQ